MATIVVGEVVFVAVAAWLLATLIAGLIALGIVAFVPRLSIFKNGLDISLSAAGVFGWLALSTVMSIVASITPALNAARRSIREAISYE